MQQLVMQGLSHVVRRALLLHLLEVTAKDSQHASSAEMHARAIVRYMQEDEERKAAAWSFICSPPGWRRGGNGAESFQVLGGPAQHVIPGCATPG